MAVRFEMHVSAINDIADSPEVEAQLLRIAQAGARGASRRAPVRTGQLRDSYEAESEPGEARFGSNLDYAKYVELGTWKMRAQPHLRPAIDDAKAEAKRG
jgi:HK97 gp10 family phage protein